MIRLKDAVATDFDKPAMKLFDWGLSLASLGYGLYAESTLWIVVGLLGCAASWFRPVSRLQRHVGKSIKRRP